jgi:hypothetical protein
MVDNLEKVNCHMHFQITFSDRLLENIKGNEIKTLPNEKEFYFKKIK